MNGAQAVLGSGVERPLARSDLGLLHGWGRPCGMGVVSRGPALQPSCFRGVGVGWAGRQQGWQALQFLQFLQSVSAACMLLLQGPLPLLSEVVMLCGSGLKRARWPSAMQPRAVLGAGLHKHEGPNDLEPSHPMPHAPTCLHLQLAPEGSGKQAELLSASSRQDPRTGQLYYTVGGETVAQGRRVAVQGTDGHDQLMLINQAATADAHPAHP